MVSVQNGALFSILMRFSRVKDDGNLTIIKFKQVPLEIEDLRPYKPNQSKAHS